MKIFWSLFIILLFNFSSILEAQELKSIYPNSSIKPQIYVSFDKTVDLSLCCKRLAIVGITATFDPEPSESDKKSTIEMVLNGYERNFMDFGFILVERIKIKKVLDEIALSMTGLINEKNAIQVGEMLSAQSVCLINIDGSLRTPGQELFKTSFKIIQVETGGIIASGVNANTFEGTAKMFEKFYNDYLQNRAYQYIQKATDFFMKSNADSALIYLQAALDYFEIKKDSESKKVVGILYNNIGAAYKVKEQWNKAYEWLDTSLRHNKKIDKNIPILANTYRHLCEIYLVKEDYKNAEKNGKKGLEICRKNNDIEQECKALKLLLIVFEKSSRAKEYKKTKKRINELLCE